MPHESVLNPDVQAGAQTTLKVAGMDCADEVEAIQRALKPLIQTNIAFALGVKAIFLALALAGHTSLWLAILADTGATLAVIANALRLLKP